MSGPMKKAHIGREEEDEGLAPDGAGPSAYRKDKPRTGEQPALSPRMQAWVLETAREAIARAATAGAIKKRDVFTIDDGDQLAEGIRKGLSVAMKPVEKALADLKELMERRDGPFAELQEIRASIDELAKVNGVPLRHRVAPRGAFAPPAPALPPSDPAIAALEAARAALTTPDAIAAIDRQIELRKAARSQGR